MRCQIGDRSPLQCHFVRGAIVGLGGYPFRVSACRDNAQMSKLRLSRFPPEGSHLFPSRTQKLSPSAPMALHGRLRGRVGRPIKIRNAWGLTAYLWSGLFAFYFLRQLDSELPGWAHTWLIMCRTFGARDSTAVRTTAERFSSWSVAFQAETAAPQRRLSYPNL